MHKVERRNQKFMAALQGVDIDKDESSSQNSKPKPAVTVEEVKAKAMARITGDQNLAGAVAEGLTPDKGLEYKIMGGTEIG